MIARTPEKKAEREAAAAAAAAALLPPEPPEKLGMTAEEALAQAEAEGLTLMRSDDNKTGYRNVSKGERGTVETFVLLVPPLVSQMPAGFPRAQSLAPANSLPGPRL